MSAAGPPPASGGPPQGRGPNASDSRPPPGEAARSEATEDPTSTALSERARRIRLLTLDVDGVLTDGRIYVDDDGREFKAYSALDGQGIKLLQNAGIEVAWISGSDAASIRHRASHLRVTHVLLGAAHKVAPWQQLRASLGVPTEACAHIGDDLPDVPLLAQCGLAVTVPHAPESVRRHAHYVTRREGGAGAVREVAELILSAQDRLAAAEASHAAPAGGP